MTRNFDRLAIGETEGGMMLTPERKHNAYYKNKRREWRDPDIVKWRGWGNVSGLGRWWKRQCAKANRRYIKATLHGVHAKDPAKYESTVNYRSW